VGNLDSISRTHQVPLERTELNGNIRHLPRELVVEAYNNVF
jgi:hypothetical protein